MKQVIEPNIPLWRVPNQDGDVKGEDVEDEVIKLFGDTDPRLGELTSAILEFVRERGEGLPFTAVLGALRLVEWSLIRSQEARLT